MKKGFTIVELLASIAIMSLIIIISVPAYNGISKTIKNQNYNSKLSMMEKSTKAFVNKYHKDEVFNGSKNQVCYKIEYLINKNVFSADTDDETGMSDPLNGGKLEGYLAATYNENNFDVDVTYQKDTGGCNKTYGG